MLWPTFKITPVIQRLNTKFYDPVLRRALFSGLPDLSEKVSSCYQLSHSGSQNHTSCFSPPPPKNVFRLLKDKTSSPVFACHLAAVTRLHPRCCCWSFRDFNPSADARPPAKKHIGCCCSSSSSYCHRRGGGGIPSSLGTGPTVQNAQRGKARAKTSRADNAPFFSANTFSRSHQKVSVMPLSCVSHHHHTYTYLSCASPSVHPAYDPSSSDILFSRKCLVSIPNPLKRGGISPQQVSPPR